MRGEIMRVNGTLINYYFHCKRQCYLHGNRLNLEDNSEIVKIGVAVQRFRRFLLMHSTLVVVTTCMRWMRVVDWIHCCVKAYRSI